MQFFFLRDMSRLKRSCASVEARHRRAARRDRRKERMMKGKMTVGALERYTVL